MKELFLENKLAFIVVVAVLIAAFARFFLRGVML